MNQARDRTAGNTLLMRIASNLYIKMVAPVWPFSCNTGIKVTSAGIASPAGVIRDQALTVGAFFWENPKTDFWSQIIRILHYQKKDGRSEKGSFTTSVHICFVPFFFSRKTACQKYVCQIFSQKTAQIVNLRNTDLDLIWRIHPECGFFGSHPRHASRTRTRVSSLRLPSIWTAKTC